MNHIDQKILELYVLNDEAAQQHRVMIESHLAECAGCRELYARMQDLYAGFFDIMASSKEEKTDSELSIKQKKSFLVFNTPSPLQEVRANYEIEHAPIRRTIVFARKHPIVTSTISFFVVGFFTLLGMQIFKGIEKIDGNPSYHRYTKDDKLEIYNEQHQLLWSMPGQNLSELTDAEKNGVGKTVFADLDGDGINEIITTLGLGGVKTRSQEIVVFNNLGKVIKSFTFSDKDFNFKNLTYDRHFAPNDLYKYHNTKNQFSLFTTATSGRSPVFLAKLDSSFNILGKYWNFGHFSFRFIKLPNNKQVITLFGKNDVEDFSMKDYAMIAILDPDKLNDVEEGSASAGFGYKTSTSEMFYIRFPEDELQKVLKLKSMSNNIVYEDSLIFHINVSAGSLDLNTYVAYDYVFDKRTMAVVNIKFNSGTEKTHKRLKDEGKIYTVFDKEYLDNIKNNVLYWNGIVWQKKPTMISPPTKMLGTK